MQKPASRFPRRHRSVPTSAASGLWSSAVLWASGLRSCALRHAPSGRSPPGPDETRTRTHSARVLLPMVSAPVPSPFVRAVLPAFHWNLSRTDTRRHRCFISLHSRDAIEHGTKRRGQKGLYPRTSNAQRAPFFIGGIDVLLGTFCLPCGCPTETGKRRQPVSDRSRRGGEGQERKPRVVTT